MDKQLIKNIRKGDVKSFEELFAQTYNVLFAYAQKYLNNKEVSKEIVNDAFLKLWENRKNLRKDVTSLKPYLFQIIHNASINFLKNNSNNFTSPVADFLFVEDGLSTQQAPMEYQELQCAITKAIDKLPSERKKIFILSRFEELRYKEIAKELGISVKTVENQISRALSFLRSELKNDMDA